MKKLSKLVNLVKLDCKVSIYVPATTGVNTPIDNREQVDRALKLLSSLFGGATSTDALGAWVTTTGDLVKEKTTLVFAYCNTSKLKKGIDNVITFCEGLKSDLGHEAVALEVNGDLYFI